MRDARRELSGLAIPLNPGRALREIGSAWERFVGTGELGDAAPRPAIARRWQQSRELEIDPFMERAPEGITPDEIQAILSVRTWVRRGGGSWTSRRGPWPARVT